MAVQFPYDLLVTEKFAVEIIQPAPVNEWRGFTRKRFEMPVHGIPEAQVPKAQQVKPAFQDFIGALGDLLLQFRPASLELRNCRSRIFKRREEMRRPSFA